MSKHTPGSWSVGDLDNDITAADGTFITYWGGGIDPIERREDAILMAAAPDLLEALEGMITAYEHEASPSNPALIAARAAIAKARGEA